MPHVTFKFNCALLRRKLFTSQRNAQGKKLPRITHRRRNFGCYKGNASNMIKAIDNMGVRSLVCFAHTLQLVVNEGLLSQRNVSDTIANCRQIVGHFKHSPLAYSRLHDIQLQMQMEPKRLQQDVRTRWNIVRGMTSMRSYFMLGSRDSAGLNKSNVRLFKTFLCHTFRI